MTTDNCTLVEGILREMNLELKPGHRDSVAEDLAARLTYDSAANRYYLTDADGHRAITVDHAGRVTDQTLRGYVEELRQSSPAMFVTRLSKDMSTLPTKPKSFTEKMLAMKAAQTDNRRERAAAAAALGNPWSANTRNLTRQFLISNLDPQLADRLRTEAGAAR